MTINRLGRGWLAGIVVVFAFLLTSASPNASQAKSRHNGKKTASKASHSVHHTGRRAKLSSKSRHSHHSTLTALEKTEIIEKINALSSVEIAKEPLVENTDVVLPDDIAQAAKEEQEEDNVDVSIDKFFTSRGLSIDGGALDPQVALERQSDFTLFDQLDPNTAATRSDIMQHIVDWLGTRYHFGGLDRGGIDCSAFTREIFRNSFNVELPRTASMQSGLGDRVGKNQLQFGDLVFFHTTRHAKVSHVGIYIGEGLFANASCSKGVTVSSMESEYWSKRYLFAKRLFTNTSTASAEIAKQLQLASQLEETSDGSTAAN
jgi:lipoprotein Spr